MKTLIFLSFVVAVAPIDLIGYKQSAGVSGILLCNGRPAVNVEVELLDEDDTDPDDLLQGGKTDSMGGFSLSGWTREVFGIEPKLVIKHFCNKDPDSCFIVKCCPRKFVIEIPDSYISYGETPSKTLDVGTLELSSEYDGQKNGCLW